MSVALTEPQLLAPVVVGMGLSLLYLLWFCWRPASVAKTLVKTGAVALPAVGLSLVGAPTLPLLALWFCALGDLLLSRDGQGMLQGGIAAFAVGHILYVAAFVVHFAPEVAVHTLWIPALLVLLALSTERWLQPYTGELAWPVRIYVVLIVIMGCVAAQQPIPQTTVFWGALAFILSDLILSVHIFRQMRPVFARLAAYAIWFFYYIAQVLIFYGFIA
ncbi:lysoplasmalogenase [Phaeobacter sp. CNT1-3]|nr:lysoplasmalogenase [Phaeobacter sp. CNT1-3]